MTTRTTNHNSESKSISPPSTWSKPSKFELLNTVNRLFPSKRCNIWNASQKWRTKTTATAWSGYIARIHNTHTDRPIHFSTSKYKLKETHRETSTQNKMDLERSATYETYSWFDEYITRNTFYNALSLSLSLNLVLFSADDSIFKTTEQNL